MESNEKWTIVKNGNGKFSPRYSTNNLVPFWPFDTLSENIDFDTLEEAIECLTSTKRKLDNQRLESTEVTIFQL